MRKFLLVILIGFMAENPRAKSHPSLEALFNRSPEISKRFVVKEIFRVSSRLKNKFSIIYGNSTYGYFKTERALVKGNEILLNFLPPGYLYPIEFYYIHKLDNGKIVTEFLFKKTYKSPIKNIFPGQLEVTGDFSTNFFSLSLFLTDPKDQGRIGPIIALFNRKGEAIRMSALQPVGHYDKYFEGYDGIAFSEPGSDGEIKSLFITPQKVIYRSKDLLGNTSTMVDLTKLSYPHHDFEYDSESDSIFYLGSVSKSFQPIKVPWFDEWSLGKWLMNYSRIFFRSVSVIGSTVRKFDLRTEKDAVVWDPFNFFSPTKNISRYSSDYLELLDTTSKNSGNASTIRFDWMHANSIFRDQNKGHLISIRNFSKLVYTSPDFKKILWTIGPDKTDTFQFETPEAYFSSQHDASINSRGNILLFDNQRIGLGSVGAKPKSRILEIKLDQKSHLASIVWEFSLNNIYSPFRGSAEVLKNGNILGLFSRTNNKFDDLLVEIDYQSKKVKAKLKIPEDLRRNDKIRSMDSMGKDQFLGRNINELAFSVN